MSFTIYNIRFMYASLDVPRTDPYGQVKYSCRVLIPKSFTNVLRDLRELISEAAEKGFMTGVYPYTEGRSVRSPLRDGDEYYANRTCELNTAYINNMYLDASSPDTRSPRVGYIDYSKPVHSQFIENRTAVYPGCYGRIDVDFFPYAIPGTGKIGVHAVVNSAVKRADGPRLFIEDKAVANACDRLIYTMDESI